ncbi:TraR/DksA C4-type zinc finger protein [Pseudomonas tussilaginis]|uniref:TraR/DksA C4-type zinc finger protein n=1 Tax=Pseudomonas sp. 5 TaxID=1619949 RepID=UPI0005EAE5A8|nr:TraR/DksA C4-type zinc finger protein [Pseudomonas sp. 5]KJK06549.1 transcriptional regulator [Pseudomonas sp. 5]
MADIADLANEQADYHLQVALGRHKRQGAKPSSEFCVDCDDAIPLARQQSVQGCDTCISCQEIRERCR